MLLSLLCGMIYLFLSMPVSGRMTLVSNGAQGDMQLFLRAWWLSLRRVKRLDIGRGSAHTNGHGRRKRGSKKLYAAALRAVHWGQTDMTIRVGLGDAAYTAVFVGGLQAGGNAFAAAIGHRFPLLVRVQPDFEHLCFSVEAYCIFSFVPGDIILAVLLAAAGKRSGNAGGKFRWKSIRLKV